VKVTGDSTGDLSLQAFLTRRMRRFVIMIAPGMVPALPVVFSPPAPARTLKMNGDKFIHQNSPHSCEP
jgi:hypothetical protein